MAGRNAPAWIRAEDADLADTATLLRRHAAAKPDAPCLSFERRTLTFRDLDRSSNRLANALTGWGIARGDRVAILSHTAPVFYELAFACAKAGAIMMPINWRLSPREVAGIVADGMPALMLVAADLMPLLAEVADLPEIMPLGDAYHAWRDRAAADDPGGPIDPDDPVYLLYTSGTTGQPKGVVVTHRNLSYVQRMAREAWDFTADSVNLVAMPLFHIGGIGYGMMALTQGGHSVLMQAPEAVAVFDHIRRYGVTHAFFVPTVVQRLVDAVDAGAAAPTGLQRILYGAAPIGESLLRRAIALFGCAFSHAYGMTETAGTVISLAPCDHDPDGARAGLLRSCGRPLPWVEMALVDPATGAAVATGAVGEIRVRSGMVMAGYWGKPEETAAAVTADGWLRTGDAAYRDADGYVFIHDRYKDMIVSGAENIYPTELENVLADHPGVAAVGVIGVPHPRWGETPKAYVVAAAGHAPTPAELIAFTRTRLAHYKAPTSVAIVPALPLNASGKLLKGTLRDWHRTETETETETETGAAHGG